MSLRFFTLAILTIVVFHGTAFGRIQIFDLNKDHFVGKNLEILRSSTKLNIQEVINSKNFSKVDQEIPRFGYTHDDVWAKLEINNPEKKDTEVFFEFRGPIEFVTAYLVKDSTVIQTEKAGMFMFPEDETFCSGHSYPVIRFKIPTGISIAYFSESAVAPHYPIVYYDHASFEKMLRAHSSRLNLLFGVFFAFFVMLLIISVFLNERSKVFLVTSFISFFFLMGFVTGMFRTLYCSYGGSKDGILSTYKYLYPLWPGFLSFYFLSLSLFSVFHLGVDKFFGRRSSKIFSSVVLISQGMISIVSIFDTILAMNLFSYSFIFTVIQTIYWSYKSYCSGNDEDRFTIVGWFVYGIFNSAQLFYFLGLSNSPFFAIWGCVYGFFTILVLLTFALIKRNRRKLEQSLVEAKLGQIATQVAHDLRSPLAALDVAITQLGASSEDSVSLIRLSIGRVRDIANELLNQARTDRFSESPKGSKVIRKIDDRKCYLLSALIQSLITEKRIQYRPKLDLKFDFNSNEASYGLFGQVAPTAFKRILSNLIDNSVDAIEGPGLIQISLSLSTEGKSNQIVITLSDNGRGIPEEILNQLGEKGASFGKKNGNGLGLHHAISVLKEWGGQLVIDSQVKVGTQVKVFLPVAEPPAWFLSKIALPQSPLQIVIVDDDSSIHELYQNRFCSIYENYATNDQPEILHFSMPDEILGSHSRTVIRSEAVYLIDYEFLRHHLNGLDIIEKLGISQQSILVTSRIEEQPIIDRASVMGVKIIPKELIGFIPIKIENNEKT